MGRKGENIFLRKDGRYEGRYIKKYDYLGKAIYGSVYAKTYQECKRKKLKVQKEDTIQKKFYQGRSSKKDLNALLKEWLEEKRGKIKESSYGRYYQLIETHIKKELGTLKINKLNSDIVNAFLKSKLRCGRLDGQGGLSKNTVYDIALILKQVFKYYKIQIDVMSISKAVGRGKSFYPKEKKQLEHYLLDLNDPKVIGILLSLFLGLREGEICGLRWNDIDLENRIILIRRTVTRVKSFNTKRKTKVIITVPKTEYSIRELPIPEKLYGLLVHFYQEKGECYVLTNTKKYMEPRSYYNYYQKILKSISIADHTYHDLRHTFATNCIEVGMDARNLMELLGHSNVATTMNIYVHGTMENKRNFIDQL